MTAESRALHPDWHHRRIAWRIQEESCLSYIGLSANGPVDVRLATDSKVGLLYAHLLHNSSTRGATYANQG